MRSNLFLRISMSAENVETGNNWRYIEVGTMNLYYPAAPPPVVSSYPLNGPISVLRRMRGAVAVE